MKRKLLRLVNPTKKQIKRKKINKILKELLPVIIPEYCKEIANMIDREILGSDFNEEIRSSMRYDEPLVETKWKE